MFVNCVVSINFPRCQLFKNTVNNGLAMTLRYTNKRGGNMCNHMFTYFIRPGIFKSSFLYICICNDIPPFNTYTDLLESVSSRDPG